MREAGATLARVLGAGLAAVLPARCVACATPLDDDGGPDPGWCDVCQEDLAEAPRPGLLRYAGALADVVQRAKYSRDVGAARALAGLMCGRLDVDVAAVDVVTYVPAHWTRALHRGFDLPALLADAVAAHLGRPMTPLLRATRRDRRLATTSSVEERARLVAGRFRAGAAARGARVLLIDDVHTTGATVAEATAVLMAAEAADVVVRALALTPSDDGPA